MRQLSEKKLLIATHNKGKLEEFQNLLSPYRIEVVSAAQLKLPEPEETETTFAGNARIKAHTSAKAANMVALADDSGICVDALGGAPGVYTADWAQAVNGRDFDMAMERVWSELEKINAPYPRTARFQCTLALAWPDGHDELFEGIMAGCITWPKRGDKGHGYDPIFQPDGYNITFAEMDRWEKNKISHRRRAFDAFISGVFGGASSHNHYSHKQGE